jgi:hypothetical protein
MQFLDAAFLWAGFAVLIPPIIHLFNFRRYKTVYFSDIRFLQNLKNVTRQRSTIKQILLMVLRMLIIACLVIAFANPVSYRGGNSTTETRKSAPPIIYIDNSFSMQAGAMSGLNLETAKSKALEIVDAFPRETDFLFITNDFEQRHNRLVKADAVRLFLQELQLTPVTPTISQVIDRAVGSLGFLDVEPGCDKSIFLISDFQKNICDFDAIKPDSLLSVNLVGISSQNIGNVSIDTVEFLTPYRMVSGQEEALVTISNYGDKPVRGLPVKLYVNNSAKVSVTTDLNPHERRQVSLKYVNTDRKAVRGRISISDFPIDYDNDIFFSYHIDSVRNVLILGEPAANKYLRALLGRDGNFQIDEMSTASKDIDLQRYKSVIINQMQNIPSDLCSKIQTFVAGGGSFMFVPSFDGDIAGYNHLLSLLECNSIISRDTIRCKVQTVNTQSALLRGAVKSLPENPDLPYLTRYFSSMSNSYQGEEVVLESDSYKKVMTANEYRAGNVYVFYTPLDSKSGNLYSHRLIVPLIYNAVATSRNMGQPYYSVIGRDNGFAVKIDGNADVSKVLLKAEDGNEFIPKVSGPDAFMNYKFFSENCVRTSGFCDLIIGGKQEGILAYNYDRRESDLDFWTADEVSERFEGIGLGGVRVMDSNSQAFANEAVASATTKPLWKIFVVIALILAVGEIFVARFF